MDREQEKWAIFWCDLLSPVIYGEIEPELTHRFLKQIAGKKLHFPDGRIGKPSLCTLKRKLKKYRTGGFDGMARKKRNDSGKPRQVSPEVIKKAIELKKDQPRRSPQTINRFLNDIYGKTVARSTLYRHLKDAHATRIKLDVIRKKVRKRWSRDHTHDLWVGDFEDGPYVLENHQVLATYLSAFIDHAKGVTGMRSRLDITCAKTSMCSSTPLSGLWPPTEPLWQSMWIMLRSTMQTV